MINFGRGKRIIATNYFLVVYCVLAVAMLTPLPSKSINNIFYLLIALPAVVLCFVKRFEGLKFSKGEWALIVSASVSVMVSVFHGGIDKGGIYIVLLLVSVAMFLTVKQREYFFDFICYAVFFSVLVAVYSWDSSVSGARFFLYGKASNPVYAANMVALCLCYLWLFKLGKCFCDQPAKRVFLFSVFSGVSLLGLSYFESRSPVLGFVSFLLIYSLRGNAFIGGAAIVFSLVVLYLTGMLDVLVSRGGSYRIDIWVDALSRINDHCSFLLGCGSDGHRFLGQFYHAHSAYLSTLYKYGIVGLLPLLIMMLFLFLGFLTSGSKWFYLALMGAVSIFFTTSGIYDAPRLYWLYFWVPLIFCLLETKEQREALVGGL